MDDAAIGAAYQTACGFSFSELTGSPNLINAFILFSLVFARCAQGDHQVERKYGVVGILVAAVRQQNSYLIQIVQ